ncbi:MAG TPA: prolipoprotein diacylglyceryl transferase family protein [Pilimelia sp.]|nr:prolipoprotein diacylglyceryl transferase family protein [Pilimelia sp.]
MLHPVLGHLGGVPVRTHDVLVGLGVAAAGALFVAELRRQRRLGRHLDDRVWSVVAGALVGGALSARLGTWLQHVDLRRNASLVEHWLYGNRSILSGLVGAYAGALLAKRLTGYQARTGGLFAPAVALGMAVGRVGCLLSELPGRPTQLPWGVTLAPAEALAVGAPPGVPLHPSFGYEILFHLLAFAVLWRLRDRLADPGAPFTLYLVGYAGFRFVVEFVRGNEVVAAGLTRPQLFLLACAPVAAWALLRLWRRGGLAPAAAGTRAAPPTPAAARPTPGEAQPTPAPAPGEAQPRPAGAQPTPAPAREVAG